MSLSTDLFRTPAAKAARASALAHDLGLFESNPHRDRSEFIGEGLRGLCRASARSRGEQPADGLPAMLRREIEVTRALGTSDFSDILANVAGKQLLMGYSDAPVAFRQLCRPGSVPNFRAAPRVGLSEFDLTATPQNGEIKAVGRMDRSESITADAYAARLEITWEALLNDDAGAFGRVSRDAGRAVAAKQDAVFVDALTQASGAGPTMGEDSTALFDVSAHGNFVSSSGGAPSVTTIGAGFAAMRTRSDPQTGRALNIPPKFLVVPGALEPTARILAASWNSALADREGDLTVVACGLLDSESTTRWYLMADPLRFDVWEVAGIGGEQEPTLSMSAPKSIDGLAVKITHDFGFAPLDWRTQYANVGA